MSDRMARRVVMAYRAKSSAIEWSSPKDPKSIPGASKLYGEYVFYSMHHGGSVPDHSRKIERELDKMGFNGWGLNVESWPEAAVAYRALVRKYRVTPEAV